MKSDTSEDAKTVHHQRITVDEALRRALGEWPDGSEVDIGDDGTIYAVADTLAAEVRRLQTVVGDQALTIGTLRDELGSTRDRHARMLARAEVLHAQLLEAALPLRALGMREGAEAFEQCAKSLGDVLTVD